MPTWMEKIRNTLSARADLKSLFIELQPDNRITAFMVAPYTPTDKESFPEFARASARQAMRQEAIPDNLLVRFEGIPAGEIPSAGELLARDPAEAPRFIVSHGGITESNSIPLRKAVYLQAQDKEPVTEHLRELDRSQGYKRFVAHEEAMGKVAEGKPAKLFFTIAETSQGVKVFNDGLPDRQNFRDHLQSLADRFFTASLQNVESLRIYRIETASRKIQELSGNTRPPVPATQDGLEILKGYHPSVAFDMRPKAENLDRFIVANALKLSAYNRDVIILQDISKNGYAHLLTDGSFAYKKEFAPIDKGLREISRQMNLQRDYPYEKKTEELQAVAKSMAQTLLNMEGIRKEQHPVNPFVIIPEMPGVLKEKPVQRDVVEQEKKVSFRKEEKPKKEKEIKDTKETVKKKTASRKKQIQPKL